MQRFIRTKHCGTLLVNSQELPQLHAAAPTSRERGARESRAKGDHSAAVNDTNRLLDSPPSACTRALSRREAGNSVVKGPGSAFHILRHDGLAAIAASRAITWHGFACPPDHKSRFDVSIHHFHYPLESSDETLGPFFTILVPEQRPLAGRLCCFPPGLVGHSPSLPCRRMPLAARSA